MQGIGNDFIVTHEISSESVDQIWNHAKFLCDRRLGIGGDGIIFVLPSKSADYQMRILNSDSSEAEMCGNGIRCVALYTKLLNLTKLDKLSIETKAGIISTEFIGDLIRVNMGAPILEAPSIPVALKSGNVLMHDLDIGDKVIKINAISMGNPHAVIFFEKITDEMVLNWGPKIERHPFFPKKTNVEFIKVLSNKEIQMRVWERGCGETLACGTGACASVVGGILNNLLKNKVTVHLTGGDLFVEWDGDLSHPVFLTGPACSVFSGSASL